MRTCKNCSFHEERETDPGWWIWACKIHGGQVCLPDNCTCSIGQVQSYQSDLRSQQLKLNLELDHVQELFLELKEKAPMV